MDADGGNEQRLTNNPHYDWSPSWSPDGKRIAFTSNRDGNVEIYVMDADGGNPQNLSNNRHGDGDPAWLTLLFRFLPQAKSLQCGVGSSRLTDNCHERGGPRRLWAAAF